jgi:nucleoside-diphosphate-sugar epimerase
MMEQISILGCGWLGLPLAVSLQRNGYKIKGSTTSVEKMDNLRQAGIVPFLIQLEAENTFGDVNEFLEGSRILIINVPPGMRSDSSELFSTKMEKFIPFISQSNIKNVLFVSSTSVFSDEQGVVDENTTPIPDSFSGTDLLKTEGLLKSSHGFNTTTLRFGGLIGEDRHPVNTLSGRTNLKGGNAPVNLIHRNDCVGLIESILENNFWGKTIHGVFPSHPIKKTYYTQQALSKNLPFPQFEESDQTTHKKVLSCVVGNELAFDFQHSIK